MLLDRFRLDGKVAVVTGAGRGIGAGCALAFAEQGANVVVAARTKEQVEGTAEQARKFGVKALPVVCDVMERADLEGLVAATMSEFGRADILVNNAGGTPPMEALHTSEAMFEEAFRFNVTSAFVLTRLVAGWTGIGLPHDDPGQLGFAPADARLLMVAYSAGFVAVFSVLALFYWNALRQRDALGLEPLELFDARAGLRRHLLCVAVGLCSILLSLLLPMRLFGFSGFVYFLLGPVQGTNGHRTGVARARLKASLA